MSIDGADGKKKVFEKDLKEERKISNTCISKKEFHIKVEARMDLEQH